MAYLSILISFLVLGAVAWLVWFLLHRAWQKGRIFGSLNFVLLEIKFPRVIQAADRAGELALLGSMEQFYNSLNNVLKKSKRWFQAAPYLVFEIAVSEQGEEIVFYTAVLRNSQEAVERQIQGFFPQAEITWINDYNIFVRPGVSVGTVMRLKYNAVLPFQTYKTLPTSTLALITNSISLLRETDEGAAIQIIVKPSKLSINRDAKQLIGSLIAGAALSKALGELVMPLYFREAIDQLGMLLGVRKKKETPPPINPVISPQTQEIIRTIEIKSHSNLFDVNLRILASAQTKDRALEILENAENAFSQFESADTNSFYALRPSGKRLKRLIYNFSFRLFDASSRILLNAEELTSIFHWPIIRLETPKVRMLKSKQAPPPAFLPQKGAILGKNQFRGQETPIRLDVLDRRRHLYIVGQTGTGKTSLMKNMVGQDIDNGAGIAVIDPHGDMVEAVLGVVPDHRAQDIVLFDPADTEWPVGLNLLETTTPQEKDFAIQEMIAIFYKLFPPETMGPIFEHSMRNAMLTLMADEINPGTLVDIPRIFTDKTFVQQLLTKVTDPLVRDFWEKEMLKMTEQYKSEMLGYLISKVGRFVENSMMRNIIGQPRSGINFSDVMDNGKILLVNLSKGRVGEMNSALLGLIVVTKLQMAAFRRAQEREEELRRDFYLYIDEFQNFTTDSIASILSEARKYRLNLTIAHQFIAQLPEKIRDAIFGNVGSAIAFRVGPDDANFLVKQFAPVFNESDLINIDNFHAYVKLLISGATTLPFNIRIDKPPEINLQQAEKSRDLSRQKYAKPRLEVEQLINKRFTSYGN